MAREVHVRATDDYFMAHTIRTTKPECCVEWLANLNFDTDLLFRFETSVGYSFELELDSFGETCKWPPVR